MLEVTRVAARLALGLVLGACAGDDGADTPLGSEGGTSTTATTGSSSSTATTTTVSTTGIDPADSSTTATTGGGTGTEEASSDGGTSTGDAPKGDCRSDNLLGCWRGMYLSPYSDHTGQIVFGGETEPHRFILGDAAKEQAVLDFIAAHRIESLALYDLGDILDADELQADLGSFMGRARDAGVLRIDAVAATELNTWDQIAAFHAAHAPFDGFVTEIEFWNGDVTLDEFLAILDYARALPIVAPSGEPPTLSVYLGWVDQAEVDAIVPLIDRAFLHVYVDEAPSAFGYGEERFTMFADANEALGREVDVWPIFSAEDHEWSAGSETFMGEWLAANGLDAAEVALLEGYEAARVHDRIAITGHQYFSYFFLERYLR